MSHEAYILAVKDVHPHEAAEVMFEQCVWPEPKGISDYGVTLRYCREVVATFCRRGPCPLQVVVPDQKALNALAGYFWVEPRRLPVEAP